MHVGKWSRVKGEQSFVGPIATSLYSFFVRIVGIAIIGIVELVFPTRYSIVRGPQEFRVPVAQEYRSLWCSKFPVAQEQRYVRHCNVSVAQECQYFGVPKCL